MQCGRCRQSRVEREAQKHDVLDRMGNAIKDIGDKVGETTLDLTERVSNEVQKAKSKIVGEDIKAQEGKPLLAGSG